MIPRLEDLPAEPRRIIWHWTGGGAEANATDLSRYMYVVGQSGRIYQGVPVAANMRRIPRGTPLSEYAAHAGGFNSYSVGVALAGMVDAVPGGPYGPHPITQDQLRVATGLVARMVTEWALPVNVNTVLTHWEVYHVHRIGTPGKWDITELPWATDLIPEQVGALIREQCRRAVFDPTAYLPALRPLRHAPARLRPLPESTRTPRRHPDDE